MLLGWATAGVSDTVGAISARFPGLAWPIALPAEGRLGLLAQQIVEPRSCRGRLSAGGELNVPASDVKTAVRR